MKDKIVTHEDRDDLLGLRMMVEDFDSDQADRQIDLLDRLIAAAEADQPPLPEGWYAYESVDAGTYHVFVRGHGVYERDSSSGTALEVDGDHWGPVSDYAHRLTPLRPTVTEADLHGIWLHLDGCGASLDRDDLEVALSLHGFEVTP